MRWTWTGQKALRWEPAFNSVRWSYPVGLRAGIKPGHLASDFFPALALVLLLAGCESVSSVQAWYFDTQTGTIFGVPRTGRPLHTTGPFESKCECERGQAYFAADEQFMVLLTEEVFSQCYPKMTTQEDFNRNSLQAPRDPG